MREQMEQPMTKLNRTVLITVAAVAGLAATGSALGAPQQFCQAYAQTAVNQYNAMAAQNIGCAGFRWHNWYDGHYQWCRSTSKVSAQSEALTRKRTLFGGAC
jgi:hypothetical protein